MLLFGLGLSGLGRERPERGRTGIDRAVEAALPLHHQGTGRIELANDPPIAGPKADPESATSSITAPMRTPAAIRAASRRAPVASIPVANGQSGARASPDR